MRNIATREDGNETTPVSLGSERTVAKCNKAVMRSGVHGRHVCDTAPQAAVQYSRKRVEPKDLKGDKANNAHARRIGTGGFSVASMSLNHTHDLPVTTSHSIKKQQKKARRELG